MTAKVSATRTLTVGDDQKGQMVTLGHLKRLVAMAAAADYPDDALVITPGSTTQGISCISVRQGNA